MTTQRSAIWFFSSVLWLMLLSPMVLGKSGMTKTSDPNHKGWIDMGVELDPDWVQWKPIKARCKNCKQMVDQYNETMSRLLESRWLREVGRFRLKRLEEMGKERAKAPKGKGLPGTDKKMGSRFATFDAHSELVTRSTQRIPILESQASYLRWAIMECERTACPKLAPVKMPAVSIGGNPTAATYQPDQPALFKKYKVAWKGPYSTRCPPCRRITAQLNAFPGWLVRAHLKLQRAELHEAYFKFLIAQHTHLRFPTPSNASGVEQLTAAARKELAALAKYFDKLLKQLKACEATNCPNASDEDINYSPVPEQHSSALLVLWDSPLWCTIGGGSTPVGDPDGGTGAPPTTPGGSTTPGTPTAPNSSQGDDAPYGTREGPEDEPIADLAITKRIAHTDFKDYRTQLRDATGDKFYAGRWRGDQRLVREPGEDIYFEIRVKNNGPDATDNVVVKDLLPPGLRFINSRSYLPSKYRPPDPLTGEWHIGSLEPGRTAIAQITANADGEGIYRNYALITQSSTPDPALHNNRDVAIMVARRPGTRIDELAINEHEDKSEYEEYQLGTPQGDDARADAAESAMRQVDLPGAIQESEEPEESPGSAVEEKPEPETEKPAPSQFVVFFKTPAAADGTTNPAPGTRLMLDTGPPAQLPGTGTAQARTEEEEEEGSDESPLLATLASDSTGQISLDSARLSPAQRQSLTALAENGRIEVEVDAGEMQGVLVGLPKDAVNSLIPTALQALARGSYLVGDTRYTRFLFDASAAPQLASALDQMRAAVEAAGGSYETDFCAIILAQPDDPYFKSTGSWQQPYRDQWALEKIGLDKTTALGGKIGGNPLFPVTIAVIDTGLDWNHQDFSWDSLWRNHEEIADNGIDDDGNGYIDDMIGWNFFHGSNSPWDRNGHGTFVAGLIGASTDNAAGIAGINPAADIMVLKAANDFGHTRRSYIAEAVVYAADNGAKIINISIGGKRNTLALQAAINYAWDKGAVIVAAAGNEAVELGDYGPAGMEHVLTVAASDIDDKRGVFSNWGSQVDIVAPGVDILSLRARRTDLMAGLTGEGYAQYTVGDAYVGPDKRYIRTSGTSFSAPIVSGVASLLWSSNPKLSNAEIVRLIKHSAKDVAQPGIDQLTGFGRLDAAAALQADPKFFITAEVTDVAVVERDGQQMVEVIGSGNADRLKGISLEIGAGEEPTSWQRIGKATRDAVDGGTLGYVPARDFAGSSIWIIRVLVEHKNGRQQQARYRLELG